MVNGKGNVSASLDIFSTVLTSLVEVTVFITGCFQCSKNSDYYHKNEQDRAWFDDERIQTEEPYCYVNPIATHTLKSNDKHQSNGKKIASNGNDVYANNGGKTSINNWRTTSRHVDSIKVLPPPEEKMSNHSFKGSQHNTEHYPSFAINVEEEYLDSKKNSFRCEGDTSLKIKPLLETSTKRGKMVSPITHRKIWHQLSSDNNTIDWDTLSFDSSIGDDISLDEYKLFDDIWRSCELENAFVDYNAAAFSSMNCNSINQQCPAGRKSPGEKFEDIFPSRKFLEAKISENVDSALSYDSESDFSLTKTSTCSTLSVIKFPNNVIDSEELSELIDLCICSNTKDNLDYNISKHLKHFCDSDFTVRDKTYSTNLLYDLVRQIMLENYVSYPSSANLSKLIPLNNVKRKVFSVMNVRDNEDTKISRENVFTKSFTDSDRSPDFIDRIINEEIKAETRQWQSFELESKAMRESIYNEIFNGLIESVATEASLVLSKKLYSSKL